MIRLFCTNCCFTTETYGEWLRHLILCPEHVKRSFDLVNAWPLHDDEKAVVVSNLAANGTQIVSLESVLWHFSNFSIISDMCYNYNQAVHNYCVLLLESK